jgi:carbamoyltransferase
VNILGISGVEGAVPFARAQSPDLDEREYRMAQGFDAAAVLVRDGTIVAAVAEERIDRKKHSAAFPKGAIASCLSQAGIPLDDVDEIAHGFDYDPYRALYALDPVSAALHRDVYSREALLAQVRRHLPGFPEQRVVHVDHHQAHAASALYTSGWSDALVVVVDGLGEAHGATVHQAKGGQLRRLLRVSARDSIGILYSLVTFHLGFDFNADEYKIMGLAPYGDPARFRAFFEREVRLLPDGSIEIPLLHLNQTAEDRRRYRASRQVLCSQLGPARHPDHPVTERDRDVAAALQETLDRVMLHLCGHAAQASGTRRLALAGGVALNCTANGKLLASGLFDDVYVQPASGDDGSALGAALHQAQVHGEVTNVRMRVPFLGPAPSSPAIEEALKAAAGRLSVRCFDSLEETCQVAAQLIAAGRVVAWYRGRMEFGPRALGNRSILADPGHPEMRDRINAMVKMREAFRPFAPAVTVEHVDRYFDVPAGTELPYMIMVVPVRQEWRALLPAVTHVDGSARVQTVATKDNPDFHALLRAVGQTTGREMVLNTSFNVKGQPIVNTPQEAIDTFLGTGIDHLFLDNHLVSRWGD